MDIDIFRNMEYIVLQEEEEEIIQLEAKEDTKHHKLIIKTSSKHLRLLQNYCNYATANKDHFYITFSDHPRLTFSWNVPGSYVHQNSFRMNFTTKSQKLNLSIIFHPFGVRIFTKFLGNWVLLDKKFELKWNFGKKDTSLTLKMIP